jgi:GalNAc-alpha-(1->4)-GalNAc-alpha-(1->3)-diNAcBac-PP-undecaprenol alpha-1,4-N-acetyl-D-galactosaminyltransferase
MDSPLKITCIIHALSLGGMERVMVLLLNDFSARNNVEVSLVLIGKTRQIDFAIPKHIQLYKPSFDFNPDQRLKGTLKTVKFIRKTINNIHPDKILCFGEYWNNLVLLSLFRLNYPIFISDRMEPNYNLGRVQNMLRNKLYPRAAGIIAQTEKAEQIAIANKWNKNIKVIGNPIQKVAVKTKPEKENTVLTVGRLIKTKHIDELIKIFDACDVPDWKLVIVGGDSKKQRLLEEYRQSVIELGLEERIHLVGAKPNVADYYKKSKIFAFTSSSEGFPNVIGEAMSFGLPVIAYDCTAGPADLITDGETGFLIEERHQKTYIEKLKKLMQDPELRDKQGARALEKIKDFDAESIAEKFFTFITK